MHRLIKNNVKFNKVYIKGVKNTYNYKISLKIPEQDNKTLWCWCSIIPLPLTY